MHKRSASLAIVGLLVLCVLLGVPALGAERSTGASGTYNMYLPFASNSIPAPTPTVTPSPTPAGRTPNDTLYSKQWGLPKVSAPAAWKLSTGAGVTIAVVDTGVDLDHPDLAGKIVAGYDFANGDSSPQDDQGHGTHVAGIAAAVTNNARGIAGLGWDARIMPVKVLNDQGSGTVSDVADGVIWAVDHGAKVVNLSLGSQYPNSSCRKQPTTRGVTAHW